jgi:hypothetical protein
MAALRLSRLRIRGTPPKALGRHISEALKLRLGDKTLF